MTQPRISVVIPCYNDAEYLRETLASVHAQTLTPLEVLVVDDGSTDDSASVARSAGATVLENQGMKGPGGARNTGILAARGEFVALLDSDDLWSPDHLAVVGELLVRHEGAAAAFSDVQLFGTHDNTWFMMIPPHEVRDCYMEALRKVVALPSATLGRTSVFREVLFDESLPGSDDYEFLVRLCRTHRMVRTDRITVYYRTQPNRRSRRLDRTVGVQVATLARECRRAAESKDPIFRKRVEARAVEVLESRLTDAWWDRDPVTMRIFLDHADSIPGGRDVANRWRWRRRILPLVRIWDRTPERLRRWLRPLIPSPSPAESRRDA